MKVGDRLGAGQGVGTTGTLWACVGYFSASEGATGKEALVLKVT